MAEHELKEAYNTGDNTTFSNYVDHLTSQSFLTTAEYSIFSVKLKLSRNGSPGATGTVKIFAADGSRFPTGAALATVNFVPNDLVEFVATWEEFTLDTPLPISDATEYCIVMECPGIDTSNKIAHRVDIAGSPYTDGQGAITTTGDNWQSAGGTADFIFEVWGAAAAAAGGGNVALLQGNGPGWGF